MDVAFIQRSDMLLKQLQNFLNSINMLMCVVCSNEMKDARFCPKCSNIYCLDCFKKTLQTCGNVCPHCRVPLQEDQLLTICWLDEMISLLKNTQSFLQDLPSALQGQNSSPVYKLQSASRSFPPVVQETKWTVSAIRWSRVFSDLFFAGFHHYRRGLLGLFTMDPKNHAGCTVELEDHVSSLDVHPTKPCLVAVGISFQSQSSVCLCRLHGGWLETADLSTCDGRRLFQEDFKASPSNYRFDHVWRVEFSSGCNYVLWWSPSELISLTGDRLTRLKMQQPTDAPTEEILAEQEEMRSDFLCMAIQRRPQLTTLHCDTQLRSMERELSEQFCKLAVGTYGGEILVFSKLSSVRTERQLVGVHSDFIWAIEWNPFVPEILASGSDDKCIKLWRTDCKQPLLNIQMNDDVQYHSLRWAPFSSTVFAVLLQNDLLLLFDLSVDRTEPIEVNEEEEEVDWRERAMRQCLSFHPSRPSLLAGYEDGRGFEQIDLRPNSTLDHSVGARFSTLLDLVVCRQRNCLECCIQTEVEKLKAILNV